MTTEFPTIILTREQLYERIWSTPMSTLLAEFGISRAALIQLCDKHEIPRPDQKYWSAISGGRIAEQEPLSPDTPETLATITINQYPTPPRILVRQAIAQLGDGIPKIEVGSVTEEPEIIRQNKQIRPEGGVMPYATATMAARAEAIEGALVRAMQERGHQSGCDDRYGYWRPWFCVGGERMRYYLYEPDNNQRHYFTKAELKATPWLANGKGWEQRRVPSGILKFGIIADYGVATLKWEDERARGLEAQLGEIVIAMEIVSTIAAKATAERKEKEKLASIRKAEREKREHRAYLEDQRWQRLCTVAEGWHQAQGIRAFLSTFKGAVDGDARLASRAAKWERWAEEYLWSIDPLPTDPEEVLRRLAKPKLKRGSYEEDEDFY